MVNNCNSFSSDINDSSFNYLILSCPNLEYIDISGQTGISYLGLHSLIGRCKQLITIKACLTQVNYEQLKTLVTSAYYSESNLKHLTVTPTQLLSSKQAKDLNPLLVSSSPEGTEARKQWAKIVEESLAALTKYHIKVHLINY